MSEPSIALYVRIPTTLRQRLEMGRVAGYGDSPWRAPTIQSFVIALLDQNLPALPPPPSPPKAPRAPRPKAKRKAKR
jgi:hypothetical protein